MVNAHDQGSITRRLSRTSRLSSCGEVSSNLVDPFQLADLLHRVSSEDRLSQHRPSFIERSPTPPGRSCEDYESEAYHDLVREGGQPLYAIDIIGLISKDPERYRDLLRPWLKCPTSESPPNWTEIFKTQLERWRDFGKWQLDNRGLPDENDDYLAFVEMARRRYDRDGALDLLDGLATDPEMLKPEWEEMQRLREIQRRTIREIRGDHSFSEYFEAVKRRLRKHDFTQTFQLQEDPSKQDPSTTWVEYFGFECWWFDRYTALAAARHSKSTEAWNGLVASGVLRPLDTPESVRSDASALARARERCLAEKDIASAKASADSALMPTRTAIKNPTVANISGSGRKTLLANALHRLETAKGCLRTINKRNKLITDFVRQTWDYDEAKRNAARQKDLLQWILERMPAVGAKTVQGINRHTNEAPQYNGSHGSVDYRESKRRRIGRSTKASVQRPHANSERIDYPIIDVDADTGSPPSKRSKAGRRVTDHRTTDTGSTALRRSARIAALQAQTDPAAVPLRRDTKSAQQKDIRTIQIQGSAVSKQGRVATRTSDQPRNLRSKRKLAEL
ncbi:reverse transcriptase [Purpureocillium lavendulum]|uniref:Reverse transcriptase n=1 Tax=Purpureocillium lavendulum TaxID=1247861 RepID=A0AB34FDM2_9HYPO|nr:reverse transcriptase [Purpureocillium lavendulum]